MAKLDRKKQKIFGSTGDVAQFGQIGSDAAGSPTTTKDIDAIQSLGQYLSGLFAITANLDEPPRGQDINALYHLITRQLAYLFEAGIPEWEVATEYSNLSSFVSYGGDVYVSLSNANIGNTPAVGSAYWRKVVDKNRDAETVDGINSTRIVYGDNAYASTLITDANAITKSGMYRCTDTAANTPTAAYYAIIHIAFDQFACLQIAASTSNVGNFYIRRASGGTFQPWQKVWNDFNDGSGSGLDAGLLMGLSLVQSGAGAYSVQVSGTINGVTDCNNVIGNGIFFQTTNTAANTPVANQFFTGIQFYMAHNASFKQQFGYCSGSYWRRISSSDVWQVWHRMYDGGSVGTNWPAALTAALGTGWTTALAGKADAFSLAGVTGAGDYIVPGFGPTTFVRSGTSLDVSPGIEDVTDSTSYTGRNGYKVPFTGTVRVVFAINYSFGQTSGQGRIYIGDTAVGIERSVSSDSWTFFEEDISVTAGDVVKIKLKVITGGYTTLGGFCICGNGYGRLKPNAT